MSHNSRTSREVSKVVSFRQIISPVKMFQRAFWGDAKCIQWIAWIYTEGFPSFIIEYSRFRSAPTWFTSWWSLRHWTVSDNCTDWMVEKIGERLLPLWASFVQQFDVHNQMEYMKLCVCCHDCGLDHISPYWIYLLLYLYIYLLFHYLPAAAVLGT